MPDVENSNRQQTDPTTLKSRAKLVEAIGIEPTT